jgi:hypothetical protein
MGMFAKVFATAALAASLVACGTTAAKPPPSPSSSTPRTPSHGPTTAPDAPVIPDAAKQHTKEGAESFVRYFWRSVDYATSRLSPETLDPLIRDDCSGCKAGVKFITDAARKGVRIDGGAETIDSIRVSRQKIGADLYYSIDVTITNQEQHLRYPDGRTKLFPRSTVTDHMMLQPTSSAWVVASLEAA